MLHSMAAGKTATPPAPTTKGKGNGNGNGKDAAVTVPTISPTAKTVDLSSPNVITVQVMDLAGRPEPPYDGDERTTLGTYLDFQRATVAWKLDGVSDLDIGRSFLPSRETTLGGIVKHLIDVERYWFLQILAGRDDVSYAWTDDDPDGDWRLGPEDTTASLLARYAAACDESRAVYANPGPRRLCPPRADAGERAVGGHAHDRGDGAACGPRRRAA